MSNKCSLLTLFCRSIFTHTFLHFLCLQHKVMTIKYDDISVWTTFLKYKDEEYLLEYCVAFFHPICGKVERVDVNCSVE